MTYSHIEQRLENPNKLYVSSVASNSTAVSGPPSIRARFWETSKDAKSFNHRDLPIYGPYHAPHLFTQVEDVLSGETLLVLKNFSQIRPVFDVSCSTSRELFEHSIGQILQQSVDWNSLVNSCSSKVVDSGCTSCRVFALGAAPTGNAISTSLKGSVGDKVNIALEDCSSWLHANNVPPYLTQKPAGCNIAIVGMAGRFPNSPDHEAFWNLLSQGLDVHRIVCFYLYTSYAIGELLLMKLIYYFRSLRTASMQLLTQTPVEMDGTNPILLMAALLKMQDYSTLDFSTCHQERRNKLIPCSVLPLLRRMRLWNLLALL